MSIRDSPFLSLGVVDAALRAVHEPDERVQLLGARVHLLQDELDRASVSANAGAAAASAEPATVRRNNDSSAGDMPTTTQAPKAPTPAPSPSPSPLPLLSARLDLAHARLLLHPPNVHAAQSEVLVVEETCRRLMKRAKRLAKSGTGAGDAAVEADSAKTAGGTRRPARLATAAPAGAAEAWLPDVRPLRARAQRILARIEEALGRPTRAHRARTLADELDQPEAEMVS